VAGDPEPVGEPREASGWGARLRYTLLNPHFLHARRLRSAIRRLLATEPVEVCVDWGCGEQPYRQYVRSQLYLGLDVPMSGRSRLMKRASVWFDGYHAPLPSASVDIVLCTEVIEHVPDPQTILNEVARLLRPGGRLILTTPQTWGVHEAPFDYFRYTEYGLRLLCERAGLGVKQIEPLSGIWGTVAQRVSAYLFYRWGGRRLWRKGVVALLVTAPLQLMGIVLDWVSGRRGDPLGHAIEAVKT
jgi:SAM-dependent methyltransferase